MYKIETTSVFEKDFKKLDRPIAKRVVERLEFLAENPDLVRPVKHLPKDLHGLCKYRIGDWRVLLWIDNQKELITLYAVDHRSLIYKRFGI